jgi:hypothetical protein
VAGLIPVYDWKVMGERHSGRRFLIACGVFALASGVLFGWCAPWFLANHGQVPIDLAGYHLPARTFALLEAYGPAGRGDYVVFLLLDIPFPLAGAWMTVTGVEFFARRLGVSGWTVSLPRIAAPLAAASDVLENVGYGISSMLHPAQPAWVVWPGFAATTVKYASLVVSQTALTLFLVVWLWSLRSASLRAAQRERTRPSGS